MGKGGNAGGMRLAKGASVAELVGAKLTKLAEKGLETTLPIWPGDSLKSARDNDRVAARLFAYGLRDRQSGKRRPSDPDRSRPRHAEKARPRLTQQLGDQIGNFQALMGLEAHGGLDDVTWAALLREPNADRVFPQRLSKNHRGVSQLARMTGRFVDADLGHAGRQTYSESDPKRRMAFAKDAGIWVENDGIATPQRGDVLTVSANETLTFEAFVTGPPTDVGLTVPVMALQGTQWVATTRPFRRKAVSGELRGAPEVLGWYRQPAVERGHVQLTFDRLFALAEGCDARRKAA